MFGRTKPGEYNGTQYNFTRIYYLVEQLIISLQSIFYSTPSITFQEKHRQTLEVQHLITFKL